MKFPTEGEARLSMQPDGTAPALPLFLLCVKVPGGVKVLLFKGADGLPAHFAKGQQHVKGVDVAVVHVRLGGNPRFL